MSYLLALLLAGLAAAQESGPVVNPHEGHSPPPSQRPVEAAGAPGAPTFPAGRNQPPSRGGTLGYEEELEDDQVLERKKRVEERRRRRNKEPAGQTHVPEGAEDMPGALDGGPQP